MVWQGRYRNTSVSQAGIDNDHSMYHQTGTSTATAQCLSREVVARVHSLQAITIGLDFEYCHTCLGFFHLADAPAAESLAGRFHQTLRIRVE
jgi:hypothetical protein